MLKKLKFTNFKSWESVDIDIGSITGLFGTNSSGKTSLIQFLLMLKQTKDNTDRALDLDFGDENSLVNLGHFENIVHRHDKAKSISWEIDWKLSKRLVISDPEKKRQDILFQGQMLGIQSQVREKGGPYSTYLSYTFNDTQFTLSSKPEKQTEFKLSCENGRSSFRFIRQQGRAWSLPGPVKSYAFPDQAKTYYQNSGFLSDFEREYEQQMDRIYYLGPLREYPRRQYTWAGSRPNDVGRRGERVIDAILAANAQGEKQNLKY